MKNRKDCATGKRILRRDDIDTQRSILDRRKARLRALIKKEGRRGGVLFDFKRLAEALLEVLQDMEPLDNLRTASEDRRRSEIFDEIVRVMCIHMRLQGRIVRSKRQ